MKLKVITRSNRVFEADFEEKDTIMTTLSSHFAGEPWGDCGGSCACATCHIYVEEGFDLFEPPSPQEKELFELEPAHEKSSRLGCQCILDYRHDNKVTVRVGHIN